jgi:hypothetical protein
LRVRELAFFGFAAFVLASLAVGAGLVRFALRKGHGAAFALGVAIFASSGLGYGLLLLVHAARVLPPAIAPLAVLAGNVSASIGALALSFGVWRLFRQSERWPIVLIVATFGLTAISTGARAADLHTLPASAVVFWSFTVGSGVPYLWAAYESLGYCRLLRRRARTALDDGELARRFQLWTLGAAGAVGVHLCSIANRLLDPYTLHPAGLLAQSLCGLVAAIGITLAFFPSARRAPIPAASR